MPEHNDPTARQLTQVLSAANKLRQQGVSVERLSQRLFTRLGLTYEDLVERVKASPRETSTPAPTLGQKALQVGQGAALGFLDEIATAVATPPRDRLVEHIRRRRGQEPLRGREAAEEVGERIRGTIASLRRQDPVGSAATELIGAVGSGVGAGRLVVSGGRSVLGRIGAMVSAGGGFGALAGAGEGETPGERALLAAFGGLSGAALGLILGGGAEAARLVGGKVANKFVPGVVANLKAKAEIRQAAADVGLSPEDFMTRVQAASARRPTMVAGADVDPFGDILEGAVQRAGPSRKARI